ncbi:MAG TPA: hypothetical protein DCS66_17380 [Flavobacteriaceae bacterium]|nr:hypothetical protein [Flavobacteriaceae bacterium]HAT66339.1 hypothetical protein [Flavobacteriaceae bacterium]|tara:strand:- start:28580 stop:29965 length:1386 start_codon:yes stop_codon:yes gene_type:complete
MKTKLCFIASILIVFNSLAQCPTTPILIETQEEIDNFASNYPNCSVLTEELRINGVNNSITNLNGLSGIIYANDIYIHNTEITDFTGLHNLETAAHLSIWGNHNIQNLEGLSAAQSIAFLELFINNGITDVSGMANLNFIENLSIFYNNNLSDLSAFSFITSLTDLNLGGGNELISLSGLENLHTIDGDLVLSNLQLEDFNELDGLEDINGSLYILNNSFVQDISVFSEINILQDLYLLGCPNLSNLYGLENIQIVGGTLRIGLMDQLTDLSIFSNLLYAGNLDIYENINLQSLSGLENLQQIDQTLQMLTNPVLSNIDALNNVSTSEVAEVVLAYNSSLSACATDFICAVVNDGSITKFINDNAVGCSSVEEIQKECLLGNEDFSISNAVFMYPNPVSETLQLHFTHELVLHSVTIYSMLGQKLSKTNQSVVDFSDFASGVYLVEVATNQGTLSKKVVKN